MAHLFALDNLTQEVEDQDEEETEVDVASALSQIVVFVIDAAAFLKDKATCDAVRRALMKKFVDLGYQPNSRNNRAGIVLYGTEHMKGYSAEEGDEAGTQGVYWMRNLSSAPDIDIAFELNDSDLDDFKDMFGEPAAPGSTEAAEALRNAISDVVAKIPKAKGKGQSQPVTVFLTADPDPFAALPRSREDMEANFQKLRHDSFVMVCPLTDRKGVFLESGAWAGLQKLVTGSRSLEACTLQTLSDDLESRWPVQKKPSSRRVLLCLSERLQLPVKVYKLIRPAPKTPSYKYIDTTEAQELSSHSLFVHGATGKTVQFDEIRQAALQIDEKNAVVTSLPETIVVGKEAASNVVSGQGQFGQVHPSLHLLHFSPVANLKLHHQYLQKTGTKFVTVDADLDDAGMAADRKRLYFTLWDVMVATNKLAVCAYKSTAATAPKLVALCAEDCVLDENGAQVHPAGFAMHELPYTDEMRSVAVEQMVVHPAVVPKVQPTVAPKAAVLAAEALVDAMSDDAVTCFTFTNDEARFATETFKAHALGGEEKVEMPFSDDFNCTHEYLESQAAKRPVPVSVLDGFLDQVLDGSKLDNESGTAGKKRAAPAAPQDP